MDGRSWQKMGGWSVLCGLSHRGGSRPIRREHDSLPTHACHPPPLSDMHFAQHRRFMAYSLPPPTCLTIHQWFEELRANPLRIYGVARAPGDSSPVGGRRCVCGRAFGAVCTSARMCLAGHPLRIRSFSLSLSTSHRVTSS